MPTLSAATHEATHSMPSHHEEAKYHHRNHDDGEYRPEPKSKAYTWEHISYLLLSLRFDLKLVAFSDFWLFLGSFVCLVSASLSWLVILVIMDQQLMALSSLGQQVFIISAIF